MRIADARRVLGAIAAVDGRHVDDVAAATWAGILDDVTVEDALVAVREFFQEEPERRIMPAHVRARAHARASARLEDERRHAPRRYPSGHVVGEPGAEEGYRAWMAVRDERFGAPTLPPAPRVVKSPADAWAAQRRHSEILERAQSPMITDLDRIEEVELARERYLSALRKIMESSHDPQADYGSETQT